MKLSHAVELFYRSWEYFSFIGEVFVLRSPLTHFDTENNIIIIIEPNPQVTRRSFRNLNCWDFFHGKSGKKGPIGQDVEKNDI